MSNTDNYGLDPNLGDDTNRPLRSINPGPADPMARLQSAGDSPEFLRRMEQIQPPRALPPAMGNFLENIGAFVPRDLSRPPPQGMPPPTWPPTFRENRRQMYVPSQANRPVTDLGKPPTFPQMPDMWQVPGIYEGVGRQLGRWGGSQRTRMMAGNLSRFTNAYMQGSQRGQREYSRIQHQRMNEAADALQGMLQSDLQNYGSAYNTYGSDPQALQTDLLNRATQLGDTEMQAALNMGPREAERLLQWRQAKYDDLSRSNTARKQHDEDLRARNPFMINPIGPDGTPTARLPKPFETKPERMVKDRVQLAALTDQGTPEWQPEDKERDVTHPPETTNDPRYEPSWMTGVDPNLTIENLDRPQNGEPSSRRDDRVRLAQADTGTMTDAPTLSPITGDEDQAQEDQDGRTVWDDVRLRSQLREARGQGGTSGGPSDQPPDQTGAQPPQPPPTGQPQGAAGGGRPGQPAPAAAQAPDQTVPPQAPAPAQTAPPTAGEQRPLTMTPALQQAQQNNLNPEDVNGMATRHLFGHMSASQFKSLKGPLRDAVTARETEIQNQLTGLMQSGLKGDALLAEIEKINPVLAQDMRAFKAGGPPPKTDPSGLFRPLMFAYDPTLNDATYRTRSKTMDSFAAGPASNNLKSAGTFIRHANRLLYNLEHAPAWYSELAYKNLPLAAAARIPRMADTVRVMQEMEADRAAMGSEFATALAQGGGGSGRGATGQERAEQAKNIDLYAPKAAIDRVREMKRLVEERVNQLRQQYETGTGMSFDAISRQFDIPGMSEGGDQQGGQGSQGGLPPGVSIRKLP